ncbi:leucine-rich_repeat domain-containing protein [Hexamita inflata]|uniref:Leucine-rich repeat domain-containing protein n=1 Tax=Hexamita inflata TaxID=28002 RepID=A0AA86NNU3_9EUKA|nr:leucine-rich repeat domain-containing protein [Hexamita inflata]
MGFIDAFIHCWHYFCQVRSGNTDKLNIISFQQNQQHKINLSTQLIFYRILTKTVVQLTKNKISYLHLNLPAQLKILDIHYNKLVNFDSLLKLTCLVELNISRNKLKDIKNIGSLRYLTKLNISKNQITDLSPLYNNDNLVELDASFNNIRSLNAYERAQHGNSILNGLTDLEMTNNKLKCLEDIKYMTNLQYINFDQNVIEDLSPLEHLTGITDLYLGQNSIQNMWPLKYLVNLQSVYVHKYKLVDINVVKYLTSLKTFVFADNCIVDIQVLENVALDLVDLRGNLIQNTEQIKALPCRHNLIYQRDKPQKSYLKKIHRIQGIFISNDQIQNINSKLKQTRRKIIQFEEQTSEIVQKAVLNQISFTGRVVNLFQSIE